MRKIVLSVCSAIIPALVLILSLSLSKETPEGNHNETKPQTPAYVIAIHGGAGTLTAENTSPELQEAYSASLLAALNKGKDILFAGGSALDAVEQVIRLLEDDSLFNAGKGAVLNARGKAELDASIMEGSGLNAGAVAGVSHIRNPISAARAVMEKSKHVMLSGAGAELFAGSVGISLVDTSYFLTRRVLDRYGERVREADKHGTVGCVALDKQGNLAAGTSTGGMMMKEYGRIGDSPVIGAGTYADNNTCAISCTGHGEYFIRYAVAHDISALMQYGGLSLEAAADSVILGKLKHAGGAGGVICIDKDGNYHFSFNTPGMLRAVAREGEEAKVLLFADEGSH